VKNNSKAGLNNTFAIKISSLRDLKLEII